MTPFVTIGIPTYNVGRFIALSIKSVLAQTYTNFELIITDDGSTDNTVEEIRKFNDPRIKLIVGTENRGISYRLNQQIDMAKGDFFFRMDGDDIMFPDRVEKQVNYLLGHPDMDVVGANAIVIGESNVILGAREYKRRNISKAELFGSARFIHPTVAGKTTWFRKWKYKESASGCEDVDLWIRSFDRSVFADLACPVLFYRDPLRFKLKTYLHRQKKIISTIWGLRKEAPTFISIIHSYMHTIVATIVSIILCSIGKDKQMIARRNKPITDDDSLEYYNLLNAIESLN